MAFAIDAFWRSKLPEGLRRQSPATIQRLAIPCRSGSGLELESGVGARQRQRRWFAMYPGTAKPAQLRSEARMGEVCYHHCRCEPFIPMAASTKAVKGLAIRNQGFCCGPGSSPLRSQPHRAAAPAALPLPTPSPRCRPQDSTPTAQKAPRRHRKPRLNNKKGEPPLPHPTGHQAGQANRTSHPARPSRPDHPSRGSTG
ncbi:hypothetical protein DFO58_1731 [Arthrobacter sp. AG1021]|nr:hypothetical protein DFO58_1731 [Arthrobacter sp. AG1021]